MRKNPVCKNVEPQICPYFKNIVVNLLVAISYLFPSLGRILDVFMKRNSVYNIPFSYQPYCTTQRRICFLTKRSRPNLIHSDFHQEGKRLILLDSDIFRFSLRERDFVKLGAFRLSRQ